VESFKSLAVPVTRRQAVGKAKRAAEAPAGDSASGSAIAEFRRQQPQQATMHPVHRFRIGQRLTMARGSRDIARAAALCQVVALLPHETGPLLYRVRSELESFERVVDEADLAPYR
jgi:hypothetical protein